MQGKFIGVQPEPGPEEQRSDKKEKGIAMDMTPRDSSSLLQPVQGAGHTENEETGSQLTVIWKNKGTDLLLHLTLMKSKGSRSGHGTSHLCRYLFANHPAELGLVCCDARTVHSATQERLNKSLQAARVKPYHFYHQSQ